MGDCDVNCPNGNCCGLTVTNGTSCSTNLGAGAGNFFMPANGTDPWTGARGAYFKYNTGTNVTTNRTLMAMPATLQEMNGHPFVVHDSTGARIGCGVLAMDGPAPAASSSYIVSMMVMAFAAMFLFFN